MSKLFYFIKILVINITLFFVLIIFLEISGGIARLVLGKPFLPFLNPYPYHGKYPPFHPCKQMKTDTLLSHIPFHENKCPIKDGTTLRNDYRDDYVIYNYSSKNPVLIHWVVLLLQVFINIFLKVTHIKIFSWISFK